MRFKKPEKKFCLFLGLACAVGIAAGIFFAIQGKGIESEGVGIFSESMLRQYAFLEIDRQALFWMIAKERGKWLLLMWAAGFTGVGIYLVYLFAALWGFFGGILCACSFLEKGVWGLALLFLFGMPQSVIYLPLWIWFLSAVFEKSSLCRNMRKMGAASRSNRQYVMLMFAGGGVLVLGILTESYFNTWLIQQVLHVFCI